MKNKFSCVMALASMLLVSSLSTEVMAAGAAANMNIGNMSNDMDYTAVVGASGSFMYQYGDSKMTMEINGQKLSGLTETDVISKFATKDADTAEVKDKYGWAISGGVYSPMLLDNMLTVGVEASWMQTVAKDDFKDLYFMYDATTAPKLDAAIINKNGDKGKISYDGLKLWGISANAKVNLPVSNGDMSFYIPASVGMVWAAGNDDYCKENCYRKGALSFNGGVGMSYSIGNGAQFGLEGKYHMINDLTVAYTKGDIGIATQSTNATSVGSIGTPAEITTIDKDAHLKLSPAYFVLSGNFSVAF